MHGGQLTIAAAALAVVVAWWWQWSWRRWKLSRSLWRFGSDGFGAARRVNVRLESLARYDAVSPEHANIARRALAAFADKYAATWTRDAATPEAVRRLFALRDDGLRAIAEIKMRLPNDLDADHELFELLRHVEKATRAALDDVRARAGTGDFPAPLGSAYDAYRAVNDVNP
jgi:hypothetical protein